jgi:hypothetical protein
MDATPLRRRRSPALRFGQATDGGSEGMALPDPVIDFAELDAHNWAEVQSTSSGSNTSVVAGRGAMDGWMDRLRAADRRFRR